MYSYLTGIITKIRPNYIVLEVNDIGYELIVSNPYSYKQGDKVTIYVVQRVREPDMFLYGFKSEEIKDLFLKLINVTGIGPKSALSILATDNIDDVIMAIEDGNAKYLTKFPGIGMKSSQQIILDLKGKLVIEETGNNPILNDVSEALHSLGYSKNEVKKVLAKITPNEKVDVMIKEALALLLK